ncbi:sensor histidine kinase [Saccharibacillus sp. CPCC 101409]|uniref:sensor histidine kinase n=1 Tax=Saccharibacillus sp. CPCC 101409 TaxID=3058041 RepID=UPI0026741B6D|nr:sensor histidine kinase [Saccharibacillus sp. CPCC 101409]MDO3410010.1 sensor histidine kinase [Saccharibacillus sp. CPCC 101409]
MQKWYQIFQRSTGLNPYVWVVFYILPFYFIFRSSTMYHAAAGIFMVIGFFVCYLLAFATRGRLRYFWTGMQMLFSVAMSLMFGYIYFAVFLAYFIGNIRSRIGFFILYSLQLLAVLASVYVGYMRLNPLMIAQWPFVALCVIAVILLPVTTYNRNRSERLQGQLEDANKRISELVVMEERQRIARDLHDTLGQKLALIGLKSDLAAKLVAKDPQRAESEIRDVQQTARAVLKELRELVTQMRGTHIEDEVYRLRQILKAADIDFTLEGDPNATQTSLLNENVISMCLKEAVTNVVKHSGASACRIEIEPSPAELIVRVGDNGSGIAEDYARSRGSGLRGMFERLEFVNGSLEIANGQGIFFDAEENGVSTNAAEDADDARAAKPAGPEHAHANRRARGRGTLLTMRIPNVLVRPDAGAAEPRPHKTH